ncbi:MAG: PKD domain-containing protein [Pseudomonadota bacterium]
MKKSISVFVMILTIVFFNSTVFAETYNGVDIPEGPTSFADEVTSYTGGDDPAIDDRFKDPNNALNIPDYNATTKSGQVTLGDNGSIVLKFTDNSLTTSGNNDDDLWIFEVGVVEPANIAISKDGSNWISVGSIAGAISGVDIDAYLGSGVELWGKYSYVRITDAGAGHTTGTAFPGVDIDAVAAISSDAPVGTGDYPKAIPGGVQETAEGATVTLNGAYSAPPLNGTIVSWTWTQLSGTPATLTNSSTAIATFTAPATAPEALTFQLTVTGNNSYTDTDTTIVNVVDGHLKPNVGINPMSQTVKEGVTVTLIANASDPDGTIQTYLWVQRSGTGVTLSSTSEPTVTFTSPDVGASGDSLEFKLTVTDNDGLENTANAIVNVIKADDTNTAPIAAAGPDQTIEKGAIVTLDGTGSSDPDAGDTITYRWTKLSGPDVTLSDSTSASPTFTAPASLENVAFVFELTVTDNGGLSDNDTVIITITDGNNTEPEANAGVDQAVAAGATVTLDGSASSDPEDSVISLFFWQQLSGTPVTLSDPSSSQPTFTAPVAGNESLEFKLTVTDSENLIDDDTCVVTVAGGGSDSDSCFINSLK